MKNETLISIVSDIHHGPAVETKSGKDSLRLLSNVVKESNALCADIVIDLGDRISDVDRETDLRNEREVGSFFTGFNSPVRFILGNHDVVNLTVMDNEEALGAPLTHGSVDVGQFHLVFWNAHNYIPYPKPTNGALISDIEWLRNDLNASHLPSVIFSHFPLAEISMAGNYYFEDMPEYASEPNAPFLRNNLWQWGHVILCVSGHVHWNSLHIVDDIPFFSIDSISETFCNQGQASGGWGTLALGKDIAIQTKGLNPMSLVLPMRAPGVRWTPSISREKRDVILKSKSEKRLRNAESMPVKAVLLDLDGVVWRGEELIEGGDSFVEKMRQAGIKIAAVTNNATKTREEYVEKLARFGISFDKEDIFTSGYAAAKTLAKISPRSTVKIIGSKAVRKEFEAFGLAESNSPDYLILSGEEHVTLKELSDAIGLLNGGVRLLATNTDVTIPAERGVSADCGAALAFLKACCKTEAMSVGKPESNMFEMAVARIGVSVENTVMIGDTIETDIDGANRFGMRSILIEGANKRLFKRESTVPWKAFSRLDEAGDFILTQAQA